MRPRGEGREFVKPQAPDGVTTNSVWSPWGRPECI